MGTIPEQQPDDGNRHRITASEAPAAGRRKRRKTLPGMGGAGITTLRHAMEITLRRSPRAPFNCNRIASVKRCAPFVENKCGVLIHRPIEVAYRKAYLGGYIYTCVDFMCGNSSNGENKFTFLDVVPDGRVVCARCEAAAIEAGLPSSSEICGRHVCIGGVKAVSHCHPERTA